MKNQESTDKNIVHIFDFGAKLLPILLSIGALYQMRMLYGQQKMVGLSFFSWTQVINDTIAIIPLTLPTIISIIFGIVISNQIGKRWEEADVPIWKNRVFLIIQGALRGLFITIMLGLTFLFVFGEFAWKSFFMLTGIYFAYFVLSSIFVPIQKILTDTEDDVVRNLTMAIIGYFLSMIVLYFAFPIYQQSTTNNLCIWRDNDTLIPVTYMNDRYAFYSGSVLSDSGSASIGTGAVVYSRKEGDRVFKCKLQGEVIKGAN